MNIISDLMYAGNYRVIPACGYRPQILNRRRFELPHDYHINEHKNVVINELIKWVKQRTVSIVPGADQKLEQITVLPMLLEPKKPRLWLV